MSYKRYSTLYLAISVFSLVVFQNLESMNYSKKKFYNFAWKTAAVGAVAGSLSLVHHGLAWYPMWGDIPIKWNRETGIWFRGGNNLARVVGYNFDEPYIKQLESLPAVDDDLQDFIRENLRAVGVKNVEQVIIKPHHEGYFAGRTCNNQVLRIPMNDVQSWNQNKNDERFRNYIAASVQHEGKHLLENHTYKTIVVAGCIPICTQLACTILKKRFPYRISNQFIRQGLKIPTGLVKGYFNVLLFDSYARHTEQEADDGICDDIAVLKEHKAWLEWQDKRDFDMLPGYHPRYASHKKLWLENKLPWIINTFDHPSNKTRIDKLNQRVNALEEKDDTKSSNFFSHKKEEELK